MAQNASFTFKQKIIPTPFEVGPVNAYLIIEDPVTLIDPGPDYPLAREALSQALSEEGLTPKDVKRVLVTHGHSDHGGLAGWLGEFGAQVLLHQKEAETLKEKDFLVTRGAMFHRAGVPKALIEMLAPVAVKMTCFNGKLGQYETLIEGEEIFFEKSSLRVLATPGHSGGHLAYYEPKSKILFSGDTVLEHISPNPFPDPEPENARGRSTSLAYFLDTLDSLIKLPVTTIFPGHGQPFSNMTQRISEMQYHHRQRLGQVVELLQEPLSPYELSQKLYGSLKGGDIFLGVSEACAHIDMLAEQGLVEERVNQKGIAQYRAIKRPNGNGA